MTEKIKIKADPLFCLRLGPRAGFTITENDDWIDLPPGPYKLEVVKTIDIEFLGSFGEKSMHKMEITIDGKPAYFLMAVKQDEK